jgi:hypothetical protein
MMNWKVSFTVCNFDEIQMAAWLVWLKSNIAVENLTCDKEADHASDAEDSNRPAQRVNPKRMGR